jgi:osomolarity two-component system response regulator SKN7
MLENPTDENVVRWGNDGDSFVVLEVRYDADHGSQRAGTDDALEREIHKAYPPETLQAQQLCKLRAPTQQVRFP